MRKFITAVTLAALGTALLPIAASASFDRHFTVFEKAVFKPRPNGNAFRFRGKLFDRRNRSDRVGRDRGHCSVVSHSALQCRGTFHLDGEIGGFGDIKYRGNLRRGDTRLNVVGGSGDFNGVAGKFVFRSLNESGSKEIDKFDLVR